jgi:hypothetical protein
VELVPVAFLAPGQRLAIAMISYNGTAALSLIADYDTMPDLDQLTTFALDELAALREAAQAATMAAAGQPANG